MALSPNGKTLVTANSGTAPFSLSIITELQISLWNEAKLTFGSLAARFAPSSFFFILKLICNKRHQCLKS